MMSMMDGSMLISMFIWIIIAGFIIYGTMLLIMKPFEKKKGSITEEDSPMKILRERFARGEIDEKEFEEKKAILQTKE